MLVLFVGAGCGALADAAGVGGTAGESTGGGPSGSRDEPPAREPVMPTTSGVDDGSDDADEAGFIRDPDGGNPMILCDVWAQDCPAGEKCTAWSYDGSHSWNGMKCVPIAADPDGIGEPCTVIDGPYSGVDTCVLPAICWGANSESGVGTCVEFCRGLEAAPTCTDPNAHCQGRELALCIPSCCPVEQTCPMGTACYPTGYHFECIPDAGGAGGAYGDPCEYLNVCDPGLFCADASMVPGCTGSFGCCAPFCDTRSSACALLDPQLECAPWYRPGQAPPGEEFVGYCRGLE